MSAISSEESPFWAFFAHHQMWFISGAIGIGTLGIVIDDKGTRALATGLLVLFIAGQLAVQNHTGILCSRCLERAPTNAAVLAKRRDWMLRLFHWEQAHPFKIMLALLVMVALDIWLLSPSSVMPFTVWPWFALSALALRFHNRVAPWCPYCKGGGGGHGAHTPDPVPSGTKRGK